MLRDFHNVRAIRANRLKPAIRKILISPPKRDSQRRGSVREPETIRENE